MQFIADAQLGGLAKYLRVLGFDTLYDSDYTDAQVAGIAAEDRRIVLTRNGALLLREQISHGCLVRETRPRKQLEEMVARLDFYRATKPFSRCPRCNRALTPVAREIVRDLPSASVPSYCRFGICDQCDGVYSEGSHWRRMEQVIGDLLRQSRSSP